MNTIQFLLLQFPHPTYLPAYPSPSLLDSSRPRAKVIWFFSLFCSILTWLPRPRKGEETRAWQLRRLRHKNDSVSVYLPLSLPSRSLQYFQSPHSNNNNTKKKKKIHSLSLFLSTLFSRITINSQLNSNIFNLFDFFPDIVCISLSIYRYQLSHFKY